MLWRKLGKASWNSTTVVRKFRRNVGDKMKYNKNVQITLNNNTTKIKLWNKSFSISGGKSIFTLIRNILEFCNEDKSKDEIINAFPNIPDQITNKILQHLYINNVLTDDFVNADLRKILSEKTVLYLERNYKNCDEIGYQLIGLNVDLFCHKDNFEDMKEALNSISIENINFKESYSDTNSNRSKIAIIDYRGQSVDDLSILLHRLIDYYSQIYTCMCINGEIIGLSIHNKNSINNILCYYHGNVISMEENIYAKKIAFLLFSKLIIDGYICKNDNMNLFNITRDLLVKRFVIPEDEITTFLNSDQVDKVDNMDVQVAVDNLYGLVKNKKIIFEELGYSSYIQVPVITIEAKLRDLLRGNTLTYISTGKSFVAASIKVVTKAIREYLEDAVKGSDEFIVAEYSYTNYKKSLLLNAIYYILVTNNEVDSYQVDLFLKKQLKDYTPLINLQDISFACFGSQKYGCYKLIIKDKDCSYIKTKVGDDLFSMAESLLLDYIGVNMNQLIMSCNTSTPIELTKNYIIQDFDGYQNDINIFEKNRNNLLEAKKTKILEQKWSYQKYFDETGIYVSKIKVFTQA